MKRLYGKIIGGDSKEKTITVMCEDSVAGVQIGAIVLVEFQTLENRTNRFVRNDDPDANDSEPTGA